MKRCEAVELVSRINVGCLPGIANMHMMLRELADDHITDQTLTKKAPPVGSKRMGMTVFVDDGD